MFGRKCAKADLSYLIKPNQRVNMEIELITDDEREKIKDLPKSVKYKATCIWVGKFFSGMAIRQKNRQIRISDSFADS